MIFRVHVLLPFTLRIQAGGTFGPVTFRLLGYGVTAHAPTRAAVHATEFGLGSPSSMSDLRARIQPDATQPYDNAVEVDGSQTLAADLLTLDFHKHRFDRRQATPPQAGERRSQ